MQVPNTAILLTPPGTAAIAVLRLAGPGVPAFLARHFSRPTLPGRCLHGTLADEHGQVLDDPLVVVSPDGEFADISLHGGPWVVQCVLDLAGRAGFQRTTVEYLDVHTARSGHPEGASATEGSRAGERAFDPKIPPLTSAPVGTTMTGRNDVPEHSERLDREVIQALPLAATELAIRMLLSQPGAWAALRVRAEASGHTHDFAREIGEILRDRCLTHLLHPPRVAIVGAPNVGKSTLANQLFAQERSITADLPGTTRDWVGEIANVDGLAVTLVDTPGVRETPDPLEREAIERSGAEVRAADLVVLVLDVTRPLEPEQGPLRRAFPGALTVVNKVDRPAAWDDLVDAPDAVRTVASTGEGLDRLREEISACFGCHDCDVSRPRAWTARQRALLARAIDDPSALGDSSG